MINYRITINGSLEDVWKTWTTEEGIKGFFAPACNIDLRIDGLYEILFFPERKAGFRGAEGMRIIALEPLKMFSFTWNQTPELPDIRPQRTLVSLKFRKIEEQKTELFFTQTGWGDSPDWDKAYDYFRAAWGDIVLYRLQYLFDNGPIDLNDTPSRVRSE